MKCFGIPYHSCTCINKKDGHLFYNTIFKNSKEIQLYPMAIFTIGSGIYCMKMSLI